ncbi:MAG: CopG family transcriptional regulator [Chloroflexota bacterium]
MVRTQIQLTEEQACGLKNLSTRRGVSVAELVREGVAKILQENDEEEKWRRASALVGRFSGTSDNVAVNHDDYLEEAYLS